MSKPTNTPSPIILEQTNNKLISNSYVEVIKFIDLMLSSNDDFNKFSTKLMLTDNQAKLIKNIMPMLSNSTNGYRPFQNIINAVSKALEDNKLELHEIPKLINIVHDEILNLNTDIIITIQDIGSLVKLILMILIETKVVKLSESDYDLSNSIIDMSIILLNKSVEIKIPNMSRYCYFFNICY